MSQKPNNTSQVAPWPEGLPQIKSLAEMIAEHRNTEHDYQETEAGLVTDLRNVVDKAQEYLAQTPEYHIRREFDVEYWREVHRQIRGGLAESIMGAISALEYFYKEKSRSGAGRKNAH